MIPIKKLIHVTDEFGNTYTPTYPKRAAGLVKHGRAHYVSDDTICLVCPPLSSETEEPIMTETMNSIDMTTAEKQPEATAIPETVPIEPTAAAGSISLETALRILETIYNNSREAVGFWAAKTAYSGVYRTAVKNGWIEDGVFVTDIPEGVDGGFLAADMQRIALMAKLLADVLKDRLEVTTPCVPEKRGSVGLGEPLSLETEIREVLGEVFEELFAELEALKETAIEEIQAAKNN